jgi:hypothetical protein
MPMNFVRAADVRAADLLEQPVLLVGPPDAAGRRWIEDALGGVVGFAWTGPRPAWWLRWLGAPLVVHEADDEPVVFGVRRAWTLWRRWLVADADDEPVGAVAPVWLLDRWERAILRRCPHPDGSPGEAFVAGDGQKAAEWSRDGNRLRLLFHPVVRDEPFLKMLILGAVLLM